MMFISVHGGHVTKEHQFVCLDAEFADIFFSVSPGLHQTIVFSVSISSGSLHGQRQRDGRQRRHFPIKTA